jgi:hypothetical protein
MFTHGIFTVLFANVDISPVVLVMLDDPVTVVPAYAPNVPGVTAPVAL